MGGDVQQPTESGPGSNTGHGHVWPRPDGVVFRCGGPALCRECAREDKQQSARIKAAEQSAQVRMPATDGRSWRELVGTPRPFTELVDSGMLWLINASVFHPRGLALALHVHEGHLTGWSIVGDGTEAWVFSEADANEKFAAAMATLDAATDRPV